MKIVRKLHLRLGAENARVDFGTPETEKELDEMFCFRFEQYAGRGYIDPQKFTDGMEKDSIDEFGKCVYFVAKLGDKIVGTVRLIFCDPLPTEEYFTFQEPEIFHKVPRNQRAELGRLIIVPPDKEKKIFFPRGLIMLMVLRTLVDYGDTHGILGGYAFVKSRLLEKLIKLKVPVIRISNYEQHYPLDGTIHNYFNQPNNPVLPICFVTDDIRRYLDKTMSNYWIFETLGEGELRLRHNLYTKFLQTRGVI